MDALSPRSANLPPRPKVIMTKQRNEIKSKPVEKTVNKDKIEDKWHPASIVTEPGPDAEIYHTGRKLGKGGFAFRTELQIHAKMRHPNIVDFYRAFAFEDHTYVVLELCPNGSLMEMVKNRTSLSLPEVRRYMVQLCGGVKYMHQRAVIHRDLKMGNLFIDAHMNLKIGDFGLAAIVVSEKERRQTLCGTPNYIAPEILDKKSSGGHDHKVDTWAIGIICYAMLTGGPPFASKTQPEIYAKLKHLEYSWRADGLNYIPPQAKDLVVNCLNLTAHARPEMDDLVDHEFFKMGSIAEELNPSCRIESPIWLQHADPRGDRVIPGYGVSHEVICAACGVGKTASGTSRSSVGMHVSKSAIAEVEAENRQGLAPVVPLPPGMIYKQFAAAKEDWATARKYPVTAAHVRSRKNAAMTGMMDMNNIAHALPEVLPVPTSALPVRAPVQSFAAQQRQQAVSTHAVSRRQPQQVDSKSSEVITNGDNAVATESAREYLRQRPIRSTSTVSTRSNSTREAISTKVSLTKSSTISEGIGRAIRSQLKAGREVIKEVVDSEMPTSKTLGRSTSVRRALRGLKDSSVQTRSTESPPTSSDSIENEVLPTLQTNERVEKARSTSLKNTSSGISAALKPRLLDPSEPGSFLKSSKPREVLSCLRTFHEYLTNHVSVGEHQAPRRSRTHPIVEKWVDYTGRYGIGYILSDHTVGCLFNTYEQVARPSSYIVVREGRNHYMQRVRKETQQYLPSNGPAIEFFEQQGSGILRKVTIPTSFFQIDVEAFGDRATAELASKKMQTTYDQEKLRLVILCDKFAKYMAKTIGSDEVSMLEEDSVRSSMSTAARFVKFYQRLGNVGVWGFSTSRSSISAADSTSFQFNFPDHTKLVLHQKGSLADVYHLQAADANELAERGRLPPNALDRRRILYLQTTDILNPEGSSLTNGEKLILTTNQFREKLRWIEKVFRIWICEGGLGQMGQDEGRVYWTGLQDPEKAKLQWVCVGKEDAATNTVSETAA